MVALEALAAAAAADAAGASPPASRLDVAVLLAPVAFPRHTTSLLLRMLADLDAPRLVARFGVSSFLPATVGSVLVFTEVRRGAPTLYDVATVRCCRSPLSVVYISLRGQGVCMHAVMPVLFNAPVFAADIEPSEPIGSGDSERIPLTAAARI